MKEALTSQVIWYTYHSLPDPNAQLHTSTQSTPHAKQRPFLSFSPVTTARREALNSRTIEAIDFMKFSRQILIQSHLSTRRSIESYLEKSFVVILVVVVFIFVIIVTVTLALPKADALALSQSVLEREAACWIVVGSNGDVVREPVDVVCGAAGLMSSFDPLGGVAVAFATEPVCHRIPVCLRTPVCWRIPVCHRIPSSLDATGGLVVAVLGGAVDVSWDL